MKLYIFLLIISVYTFYHNQSYGQETRMTGTLTLHPWVDRPIIYSNEAQGGLHQVANLTERDNIPTERRQEGMIVTVIDADGDTTDGIKETKIYRLGAPIEDNQSCWIELTAISSNTVTIQGDITSDDTDQLRIMPNVINTEKLADKSVTLEKMAPLNDNNKLLGSGDSDKTIIEITIGDGLKLSESTLSAENVATANLAKKAEILNTARAINGVSFDGSSDISINAIPATESIVIASGDVTFSNEGIATISQNAITTEKIANNSITFAKMQSLSESNKILGSGNSDTTVKEIALGSGLSLNNDTLYVTVSSSPNTSVVASGDVTFDNDGIAHISNSAVNSAKIDNGTITNEDINTDASISGTKINPDFGTQSIKTTGSVTCLTLTQTSDRRLKKNIETLTDVLNRISQIRGVRFEFIDQSQYATGPQIGLIAQELQAVYPELVSTDTAGLLSVNYSQLSAVLVQAISEQQAQLKLLEKRIQEQEIIQNHTLKRIQQQQKEIDQITEFIFQNR